MNIKQSLPIQFNPISVLPTLTLILSISITPLLHAEIFKCVDSQGHVSFSAIPCEGVSERPIEKPESVSVKGSMEKTATDNKEPMRETSNIDHARLTQSKQSEASQDRQLLFDVDDRIKDLQKNIDQMQRSRAKEIAAVDIPEASHGSVYRQQSEIRTRFDTVITSELNIISQLLKKRQALIHKVM
ncbi:MAG: hypothetical protein ACJAVI_001531 [Candidatus Azotimanducaceae bacterium]|jgi:hypothetical protein